MGTAKSPEPCWRHLLSACPTQILENVVTCETRSYIQLRCPAAMRQWRWVMPSVESPRTTRQSSSRHILGAESMHAGMTRNLRHVEGSSDLRLGNTRMPEWLSFSCEASRISASGRTCKGTRNGGPELVLPRRDGRGGARGALGPAVAVLSDEEVKGLADPHSLRSHSP